jgi:hypothetical protein
MIFLGGPLIVCGERQALDIKRAARESTPPR